MEKRRGMPEMKKTNEDAYENVSLLKVSPLTPSERSFINSISNRIIEGQSLSHKQKIWYAALLKKYNPYKTIKQIPKPNSRQKNKSCAMGMIQPPADTIFFNQSLSDKPPWE
jgi:DNA replication initiation complex subunit (GINS family)